MRRRWIIIKDPEFYRGKKVVISGGGDSARLDCIPC